MWKQEILGFLLKQTDFLKLAKACFKSAVEIFIPLQVPVPEK